MERITGHSTMRCKDGGRPHDEAARWQGRNGSGGRHGERNPDWTGNVRATLYGLTLATTPREMLRASLEAIAYRFAVIPQRLCGRPECEHRLIASGGALLHSLAWMQIFADVLGRLVGASAEPEATSRGIALLALRTLGAIPSLDAVQAADGAVYELDSVRHGAYQAAIARQRWLYDRLIAQQQEV